MGLKNPTMYRMGVEAQRIQTNFSRTATLYITCLQYEILSLLARALRVSVLLFAGMARMDRARPEHVNMGFAGMTHRGTAMHSRGLFRDLCHHVVQA